MKRSCVNKIGLPKYLTIVGLPWMLYASTNVSGRDILPEPFDYTNHAGNVAGGVILGCMVGIAARAVLIRRFPEGIEKSAAQIRTNVAAGARAVGAAVNALFEVRTGLSMSMNVPDMIDFAYGTVSSAVAGFVIPSISTCSSPETQAQPNQRTFC